MQNLLRALIVDSEAPARELLQDLLATHRNVRVVGEASSAPTAVSLYEDLHPNLVFMDVQMPKGDGFSLLPKLQPLPAIIFVTACDQFAVRAFEVDAVDYLLKPVRPDGNASRILSCFGKQFSSGKVLSASTKPSGIAQYPRLDEPPERAGLVASSPSDYFSASFSRRSSDRRFCIARPASRCSSLSQRPCAKIFSPWKAETIRALQFTHERSNSFTRRMEELERSAISLANSSSQRVCAKLGLSTKRWR
jgi:CheY-like chemotaxis protein